MILWLNSLVFVIKNFLLNEGHVRFLFCVVSSSCTRFRPQIWPVLGAVVVVAVSSTHSSNCTPATAH